MAQKARPSPSALPPHRKHLLAISHLVHHLLLNYLDRLRLLARRHRITVSVNLHLRPIICTSKVHPQRPDIHAPSHLHIRYCILSLLTATLGYLAPRRVSPAATPHRVASSSRSFVHSIRCPIAPTPRHSRPFRRLLLCCCSVPLA